MKKVSFLFSTLILAALLLGACNLGTTPPTDEQPVQTEAPVEVPATEQPSELPAATEEAPTLLTVDLVGPPMEVGSKFTYVDGTVLVAVPGGAFTMGYNFDDNPEREVTVGDFWIYSTKVTNQQYALCVQAGKCSPPDLTNAVTYNDARYVNYPVTGVNHTQATDYCAFVKGRLPTEAQWEKAARGPEGNIFPWGNGAPTCALTNYANCTGTATSVRDYPSGLSYYEAWDMGGNVREWAADWYEPLYNVDNPVADPLGPQLGERRSVRSAGYTDSANATIAANRFSLDPSKNMPDLGFRCTVEEPTAFAPWCEVVGYAGTNPDGSLGSCTPQVQCNDVSISVASQCNGTVPYTIVTFQLGNTPPAGWTYNAGACSAIPGEQTATKDKFLCTAPDTASASGSCMDLTKCEATCPVNYNKAGDSCVWNGGSYGSKECLPGSTYDPLTQCCTTSQSNNLPLALCPAGYFFLDGVCVPNPKSVVDSQIADVSMNSCIPQKPKDPGNPGENSCNVLPTACTKGYSLNTATCQCCSNSATFSYCYTP